MKPFSTYQRLDGEIMTDRDKAELNSPFWNEGKWENYVKPFLKEDPNGKLLADMGCNAGLYLKLAEDMGFRAIGIDSDKGAVERGRAWRDKNGGKYDIIKADIRDIGNISLLPIVDYMLFVNSHYYMTVNEFLEWADKLMHRARYAIIVTAEKKHLNRCWASADVTDIRSYFKLWEEVGFIDELPQTGEHARRLWSLCFKSRLIERARVDSLDSSNHVQDEFYEELDRGVPYQKTRYYRIIKPYRKKWSKDHLERWFGERIALYEDVKKRGQKVPIIVDKENKILDGNHRYSMLKSLGNKEVFIRRI